MNTSKILRYAFLGLATLALDWPVSIAAYQLGVLTATVRVAPERIAPGGKTQITIVTNDGFHQPIPMASIKISTATGYYESSNQNIAIGNTNQDGVFQAIWHSNLQTPLGPQKFEITASKNAYIGKYPITATATVIVEDPSQSALPDGQEKLIIHGQEKTD